MKKVIEPFNIHLDAFWERDLKTVERMIRKLDASTIKKLYGMTITITDKPLFPHPVTGESMAGLTRSLRGRPYLIILGSKPSPKEVYHEVAHAIGIESETEAMSYAERAVEAGSMLKKGGNPIPEIDDLLPMSPDQGPPLPRVLELRWPWKK